MVPARVDENDISQVSNSKPLDIIQVRLNCFSSLNCNFSKNPACTYYQLERKIYLRVTVKMNLSMIYRFLSLPKGLIMPIQCTMQARCYAGEAKPRAKKPIAVVIEKKIIPVETDVNRLLTHVCGTNIYKEGGEDVKLKPDSEYPDWLWTIRTGPPPPLEELDPNTKQYWRRLRLIALRRNNKIQRTKKF